MTSDPRRRLLDDLRGGVRIAIDGVQGVTGVVEGVHRSVVRGRAPLGAPTRQPLGGIPGLVYRSVRGTTSLVGRGLDAALAAVQLLLPPADGSPLEAPASRQRDAIVSALNGVAGDHLARTGNPLALPMGLRAVAPLRPRLLLLVHGLCMNDRQWERAGHDHGAMLAEALDATPVYLRYNSGRHVSDNGAELAVLLDEVLRSWPVPVARLTILGHSMGGLVARSAVHQAQQLGLEWPERLRQLVFLGTPHHGAPLERGGNWLHRALGLSPYLSPFTRLSGLRSEGITDLRHGNLLASDRAEGRFASHDTRTPVPLPQGVDCFAIAGTLGGQPGTVLGDGLVAVDSALGRHRQPALDLGLPPAHGWVAEGVGHLDLLSDPAVAQRLLAWLRVPPQAPALPQVPQKVW